MALLVSFFWFAMADVKHNKGTVTTPTIACYDEQDQKEINQ
jgi:hypothetical protein